MATPARATAAKPVQQRRPRHVPIRTCVACRETAAKRGFIRIVRTPAGQVQVDESGKAAGRGAYLHATPACWEVALKRGRLGQSLRVTIDATDRQALTAFAAALPPDDGPPPTKASEVIEQTPA